MKVNLIILSCILAVTALVTTLSKSWQPEIIDPKAAPDFTYETISGKKGALYKHQGKVVLLHFWATWCPPCIVEFPDLIDLAQRQKGKLVILAVSTDKKKSDIDRFLKRLKRPLPDNFVIVQDGDNAISQGLYQTYKLPESYLITKNSTMIEKIVGPQENWNSEAWNQKLLTLSSE